MRVTRFLVQGYKNLVAPVLLEPGDGATVIYGRNNVGKSNLLEALGLPFTLLGLKESGPLPLNQPAPLAAEKMRAAGYPLPDLFTFGAPTPIRLEITLEVSDQELRAAGITPVYPSPVTLRMEIDPSPPVPSWQVTDIQFGGGGPSSWTNAEITRIRKYTLFLARNYLIGGGGGQRRFSVVGATRGPVGSGRGVVPERLKLALYDLQESTDADAIARWELFRRLVAEFDDILRSKEIRAIYSRQTESADLVLETPHGRVPCHLLGTGMQQLLVLFGELCVSSAHIVAIEEPEANLAFALQGRVRALLGRLSELGRPIQVFVTSHSPMTEQGHEILLLKEGVDGPVLGKHPATQKNLLLEVPTGEPLPAGVAPPSWVTEEGLVRVPGHVLEKLGMRHGGGVVFMPEPDGGFRLLTNAQAADLLGWSDP